MLRLISANVDSFGLFAEPFTLPIERRGLVLIEAENRDGGDAFSDNASGKSLLIEGVFQWPLFGKMARYGDERLGPAEVCVGGRDASVALRFETAAGVYEVHRRLRALKRASHTLTLSAVQADGSTLPVAGLPPDLDHATEYLASRILGFDYPTLRHALIVQGVSLDVADAGFASQMRLLESVLRFDVFTRAASNAAEQMRAEESALRSLMEDLNRAADRVQQLRATIADLDALHERAQEVEIRATLSDLDTALKSIHRGFSAISTRAENTLAAEQKRLHTLDLIVAVAQGRAERFRTMKGACPECDRPITKKDHERWAKTSAAAFDAARRDADRQRAVCVARQKDRDAAADIVRQHRELTAERSSAQKALDALLERTAQRESTLADYRRRLAEQEHREATITDAIAARRQAVMIARISRETLDGLKPETLAAAGPVLNEAAERYSSKLTGGAITVQFETARESRAQDLIRVWGASAPRYRGCSLGERRRIDLIIALSLRHLSRWRMSEASGALNVCAWDEVLDHLDESGLRAALDIVHEDLETLESVFIVTHNPDLRSMLPWTSRLTVIREGGVSRVVNS